MRIAITGSSGFIGSALARDLEADDHEVVRIVRSGGGPGTVQWDIDAGQIDARGLEGLITPLVGMIASKDFTAMTFEINGSTFRYGLVINAVIYFVSVAAVVFFAIVKPVQAIAARRAAGEATEDAPAPSDEAVLLAEIRDLLRARAS